MNEDFQKREALSATGAFSALMRLAKAGQTIYFRSGSSNESIERIGILRELHEDGMVIDTDSGTEWIPAKDVQTWRLPKQGPPSQSSPQPYPAISEPAEIHQEQPHSQPALPDPVDLELLFAGEPVLPIPEPSFNIQFSSKDMQQNIIRWKNKYDYAKKIHEPTRMSQEVARIAEIAEIHQDASLYYLAGLLADSSGLGSSCAKNYFENALEINQQHQGATTAIAALAIRDKDWGSALKYLLWAVRLEGDIDKTNLVRCIGQCVLHLNDETIPQIGSLLLCDLPEAARRLATNLLALVVKEDSIAYLAALSNNITELRQTKIGNDLFPWNEEISPPINPRIAKLSIKPVESSDKTTRRGRVSAYYPVRNFGFIVDESTGQTWFFHKKAIIGQSLLSSLIDGNVHQDVTFSGSVETQSGKYPIANDVALLSEDAATQNEAPKRAPLKLRLQAIPKDGSSFAKAMEAEQLDQLDKAESFYREEIVKQGGHFKSAIKNLAALHNRRGQPDTAIEILNENRRFFNEI